MNGDRRRDVVAGEHEHRVARGDAPSPQRGDGTVDRGVELGVGSDRSRSTTATRSGARRAAWPTRSTGSVPQYPAARNRAARRRHARRVAGQVVAAPHLGAPFAAGSRLRVAPRIQRGMLRSARVNEIPSYPATVWALVDEAAERWADHVLLVDDHGRSLTGRQLREAALGVAADLATRGVTTGTMVSWQLPTTLETVVVMVALVRLGAVQNPLIPILREREVTFITRQVGTEVMITTERWRGFDHGALARDLAAEQGFSVIITDLDTDPATIGNTLRLAQGDPAILGPLPDPDESPMRWIYSSSGTTADPKGARHTDRSVMHSATGLLQAAGMTADDVNPIAIPISHIGGINMLTTSLMSGMRRGAVRGLRSRDHARTDGRAGCDPARERGAVLSRVLRRATAPR